MGADLNPLLISRTEVLLANWQKSIDTKCVQLLKPLLCLSVDLLFTSVLNPVLSNCDIICENNVKFVIKERVLFCSNSNLWI